MTAVVERLVILLAIEPDEFSGTTLGGDERNLRQASERRDGAEQRSEMDPHIPPLASSNNTYQGCT